MKKLLILFSILVCSCSNKSDLDKQLEQAKKTGDSLECVVGKELGIK